MKYLAYKGLKLGQLILDRLAGTLSTTKACLLVEEHQNFVGCDKDIRCLEKLMPSVVEAYASQLLSLASDLTGDEGLIEAARAYLEAVKCSRLGGALSSWVAPPELLSILAFKEHVVLYITTLHKDYSV